MGSSTPAQSAPNLTESAVRPKILAVDDQLDSLRLLQLRLQSVGMDCVTCSSGPAALALLEQHPVDVIILDVMMPGMDGFEVCRRLKANPQTRDIPVLFLTARLEPADRIRGLEAGGHDYLSKPTDQQELLARTRAAIRVKRLQDQLKEQLLLQQRLNQLQEDMLGDHWDKTFGQLAASLAHEINNPLAAAMGSVQLLGLDTELREDVRKRLTAIEQSLQRVGKKLRSLLLIAHTHRQPQLISLTQLVEDLAALANYHAVAQKISIVTDIRDQAEWQGCQTELARAVLYVLNNAIEAVAGQKGGQVTIRVETTGDRPTLRIRDNGPGIPATVQARIFDPFFTTKAPPHNGAGLYLANRIIKAAGGALEFCSPATDAATEFSISLPAPA
jgi:two-component system, NtrC family, sensor kinase